MKNKQIILGFILLAFFQFGCVNRDKKIENIRTFAKVYGYVRWFYPGDEAAKTDWDKFAVYGIKRVENARNQEELKLILEELFLPIASALKIEDASQVGNFDLHSILPSDTVDCKAVSWLHYGVNLGEKSNIYQSTRMNRDTSTGRIFCLQNYVSDISKCRGKEVKLVAKLKAPTQAKGNAYLFLTSTNENIGHGYLNVLRRGKLIVKPTDQWQKFEKIITVNQNDAFISSGFGFDSSLSLCLSGVKLMVKENNRWEPIKQQMDWHRNSFLYDFKTDSTKRVIGEYVVEINSKSRNASVGKSIKKDIGNDLVCVMPLALYGNKEHTFPVSDPQLLKQLNGQLLQISDSEMNDNKIAQRLANVVISWNVFQHFFPYFDVVHVDWGKELSQTLDNVYNGKSEPDYFKTLSKMVASLQDGHGVVFNDKIEQWGPPFAIAWIENKAVVLGSNSFLFAHGDIIERIDGKSALEELQEQERYISGSPQLKRYRALNMFGSGFLQSEAHITLIRDGKELEISAERHSKCNLFFNSIDKGYLKSTDYGNGIYYANSRPDDFDNELDKLLAAKWIIVSSLYGSVDKLIPHLISEPIRSTTWRVPITACPDRQETSFDTSSWKLQPEKPFIQAKIAFIKEPFNVSFGETLLDMIDHYKLGELVGDTTAGTNGNVNFIPLMGGYSIMWTGMKVLKHNGSQLYLKGFRPDYPVKRTIKAIKDGRNEYLEKAIEAISER